MQNLLNCDEEKKMNDTKVILNSVNGKITILVLLMVTKPNQRGAFQLLVEHLLQIDNDNKYPLPVKIDFPKSFEFKPKNLAQSGLKNEQSNCSHISTLIALNRCNLARLIKGEHMTFPDGSPDFPSMILADVIR